MVSSHQALAASAEPKQGLFVSNQSLGIHGAAELVVFSDLYLDHASVSGSGTLTLLISKSTKIISKNSKINNLNITGKNYVGLEGDLHIVKMLSLNQATLDVSRACLTMSTNAILVITNGGKILTEKPIIINNPDHTSFRSNPLSQVAILTSEEILPLVGFNDTFNNSKTFNIQNMFAIPNHPPPKNSQKLWFLS